jgi:hypothetical protein
LRYALHNNVDYFPFVHQIFILFFTTLIPSLRGYRCSSVGSLALLLLIMFSQQRAPRLEGRKVRSWFYSPCSGSFLFAKGGFILPHSGVFLRFFVLPDQMLSLFSWRARNSPLVSDSCLIILNIVKIFLWVLIALLLLIQSLYHLS